MKYVIQSLKSKEFLLERRFGAGKTREWKHEWVSRDSASEFSLKQADQIIFAYQKYYEAMGISDPLVALRA